MEWLLVLSLSYFRPVSVSRPRGGDGKLFREQGGRAGRERGEGAPAGGGLEVGEEA